MFREGNFVQIFSARGHYKLPPPKYAINYKCVKVRGLLFTDHPVHVSESVIARRRISSLGPVSQSVSQLDAIGPSRCRAVVVCT